MKSVIRFISIASLVFLASCGDDMARNKRSQVERVVPAISIAPENIASGIHRVSGTLVLKTSEEIALILANNLPSSGYRLVPDMDQDDEGPGRTATIRPNLLCGTGSLTGFNGVNARIADCASKNPLASSWDGRINASSGEGSWRLVAFTENSKEIWIDNRTGLVWSDVVDSGNWCQASGNTQIPMAGATFSTNCSTLAASTSFCTGASIEGIADITWRLPTRNDYLQADLDGLRFVVATGSASPFWTATMDSSIADRSQAWAYSFGRGTLTSQALNASGQVRCIGAPKL